MQIRYSIIINNIAKYKGADGIFDIFIINTVDICLFERNIITFMLLIWNLV